MKRNIAALVLAAGNASRMGTAKQLLAIGSQTLLRRAIEAAMASSVGATFVVIGANAERMRDELRDLRVEVVENRRWSEGIGTSVSAGIDAIAQQQPTFGAAVVMTCDQPHVSAATIDALIAQHEAAAAPLVASRYSGTIGVPALFGRQYFDALRQLPAEKGAKELLLRHRNHVATVEFALGAIDLDTPADYERFRGV